jgi:hypothetical protein
LPTSVDACSQLPDPVEVRVDTDGNGPRSLRRSRVAAQAGLKSDWAPPLQPRFLPDPGGSHHPSGHRNPEICIAEGLIAAAAAGSFNSPFRGRTLTTSAELAAPVCSSSAKRSEFGGRPRPAAALGCPLPLKCTGRKQFRGVGALEPTHDRLPS